MAKHNRANVTKRHKPPRMSKRHRKFSSKSITNRFKKVRKVLLAPKYRSPLLSVRSKKRSSLPIKPFNPMGHIRSSASIKPFRKLTHPLMKGGG